MILGKIFKTKRPFVGMVHFPPLLGYGDFPGLKTCFQKSLKDAKTLEKAGVDGIIFENNYDIPHKEFVGPETTASMTFLVSEISKEIKIPFGINVLWNDFKASLSIAKITGASFVRIPVFVDDVETQYGKIFARPKEILNFRKKIEAEEIALFVDVQVKHAKMLKERDIEESVKEAIKYKADAIIVTGEWTGKAPSLEKLKRAKIAAKEKVPVLIGSGINLKNLEKLLPFADGVIVGTALKEGKISKKLVNLKPWQARISFEKTKKLVDKFRELKSQE